MQCCLLRYGIMPRMPASAGRKEHKAGLKGDAKILLNAVGHSMLPAQCLFCQIFERVRLCVQVALQDHYARILQIPGAKLKPASLKPVSSSLLADPIPLKCLWLRVPQAQPNTFCREQVLRWHKGMVWSKLHHACLVNSSGHRHTPSQLLGRTPNMSAQSAASTLGWGSRCC